VPNAAFSQLGQADGTPLRIAYLPNGVGRVIVAEPDLALVVDIQAVVVLLACREYEKDTSRKSTRKVQAVGGRRESGVLGLVERINDHHHGKIAALPGSVGRFREQLGEEAGVLACLRWQPRVVEPVPDDELRTHVQPG
jgi:hypothetical protein